MPELGSGGTVSGGATVVDTEFGYAEDTPHVSGDMGAFILSKRTDTAASSAGTDGDYATFNTDSLGRLWVHVSSNDPGSGAANLGKLEDAPHTTGDTGVLMLGVRNASSFVLSDNELDYTPITVDSNGRIQIGRLIPGTGLSDLGKAEDAPHTSSSAGVFILAVRNDALVALTDTDLDYSPISVDQFGRPSVLVGNVVAGTGNLDLGKAEDTIHAGGSTGVFVLAVRNDDLITNHTTTNGDYSPVSTDNNGAVFNRPAGNRDVTVLASAARTATPTKVDQINLGARSLILVIDVTAITATPSVVFTIQGKDPLSGKYYTILASAAITGVGTTVLRVDTDLTAVANSIAKDMIPKTWAVDAVHGDADSITYSVGALLVS